MMPRVSYHGDSHRRVGPGSAGENAAMRSRYSNAAAKAHVFFSAPPTRTAAFQWESKMQTPRSVST